MILSVFPSKQSKFFMEVGMMKDILRAFIGKGNHIKEDKNQER
jgi:hypothetical protein